MLLYVDKKALRYKKIKYSFIAVFTIFFVWANVYFFGEFLHTPNGHIVDYKRIKTFDNKWYQNSVPVVLYSSFDGKPKVMIIPQDITREIITEVANVFMNFNDKNKLNILFTNDVCNRDYLLTIASLFVANVNEVKNEEDLIISSNYDYVKPFIYYNRLQPSVINYSESNLLKSNIDFQKILNKRFPLAYIPRNNLEIEQESLKNFADDYKDDINNLLDGNMLYKHKFSHQSMLFVNKFEGVEPKLRSVITCEVVTEL